MEELKVQNSLLLQLINSKNRQNQILFQQYDQLAADNRHLQTQTDQLRTLNNQLKKQIAPTNTHPTLHESPPRPSPFDVELLELKKRNGELLGMINELKAQLEERGGTIILLQEELQKAKLEGKQAAVEETRQAKAMLQLKEQAVAELTEYMQVQAEKIGDLTREGILAIDNYEGKLAEKDTHCQTLSEQIAQLNQTITQLQVVQVKEDVKSPVEGQKVKELQAIILLKEQSIAELSEFLQMQSDKVSKLQANLSESNLQTLQDEIENLKQIAVSKQQSITELSEFLNILSLKNKEYEQKLQQFQQQKSEMPQQVNSDVVKNLQDKVEQLVQQNATQNERLIQLASKPSEDDSLLRESEMLRARLSTREDEVALLNSKLEDMEAEISDLRLQLDEKVVKITILESISQQNDTEFPNDQQQGGHDEPKAEAVVEKQEVVKAVEAQDFESLLQMKQSEIQTLKATVEQKDQSLQDFTDFISQQTEKITNLEHTAEELETIIKSKEQSIEQLRTFLEESYAKNAQVGDRNRQMQENLSRLQEQMDGLKKYQAVQEAEQVEERINIILPPSQSELGSPLHAPPSSSLHERIQQLQSELASKTQTIAELSDFMNSQAESLRAYRQKQEQSPSDRIAELEAIIKLKEQSNFELSEFLQQAYAKTAEMDMSLNESQRNMLNAQEELFVLKVQQGGQGNRGENNIAKEMRETIQELKVVIAEKQYNIQELKKSSEGTARKWEAPSPSQVQHQLRELREQIQSLEDTLASKQDTIGELTDFMNQQAQELDSLTSKLETMHGNPPCAFPPADEQNLRRQVADLSQTLRSKDENINEMTEFMTQQAEQLEELRSSSPEEGKISNSQQLLQKIGTLQQMVQSKELSQSETNQFLQEAYSKIATLEEQKSASTKREVELTQKMDQEQTIIRQLGESNKKALLAVAQAEDALKGLTQRLEKSEQQIRQLKEQPTHHAEQTEGIEQKENIKALKTAIEELEEVVNTKSQTIAELSQFMNEQSLRVEELQEKLNGPEGNSKGNKERIEELQTIIKSKEISIAELTSFLEEAYAKNAELQAMAQANPLEASQQIQKGGNQESKIQPEAEKQIQQQLNQQSVDRSERESQLAKLNSEIVAKNAQISKLNALFQNVSRQLKEEEQKLRTARAEANDAQSSYNNQLDEYNHHRESMESQIGNVAQALQEQVTQIQQRQSELSGLEQQVEQLNSEIRRLEDVKKGLKMHGEAQNSQLDPTVGASPAVAELQAKIMEYEGFLNDREEEMAAMMEVMENLQAEISNKNEIINHLQESNPQSIPDASNKAKMQQLQVEIMSLKQTIQDMQGVESTQQKQVKVLGGYARLEAQEGLMEQSNKLKQQYQQELNSMKVEQLDLERELNLNDDFQNEEQVDNNEQLTVLQVIEQILVYSEEDVELGDILRLMEVLKRSYLRENECIIKENIELKDTLTNLLEVNNSLVEELEKIKAELEQQHSIAKQEQQRAKEAEERANRLELNYQQEIKQLRRSISGLRDESPIGGKAREEDLHTISRLQDEVVALRQENQQREVEMAQLKTNSNKKFVNELNNLLDSCTVAKEGEELRELEEELERVAAERDEAVVKCKDYEGQLHVLEKQCLELTASLENAVKNPPQASQIQNPQGQDSLQTAELLASLEQPAHESERQRSVLEESSVDKLRGQNQQLHVLLQEKSAAINELQETMLGLEKGYNSEIMCLRKNIAELKNEGIALRKSLYQADPNGVDIHELIKDTFDHAQQDTHFFRPNYPTYTHSLLLAHPHNASYYSDAQQPPRPPSQYQRFFPNNQLNLGEKFMGRRCRQASPFSYGGEASRATAWQGEYPRY